MQLSFGKGSENLFGSEGQGGDDSVFGGTRTSSGNSDDRGMTSSGDLHNVTGSARASRLIEYVMVANVATQLRK